MFRILAASLLLCLTGQNVQAACAGRDLLQSMPEAEVSALRQAVDGHPYARGNFWRATRGNHILFLVGTYHIDDPRHDAAARRLAPYIDSSATVLVESGPEEEAKLQSQISRDPSLLFLTEGPTLPELLEDADWQALVNAMGERDIPAIVAAKMRPWFISAMLAIPPCAKQAMRGGANGLDARVIAQAERSGVAIRALEPFDSVFAIFDALTFQQQLDMILTSLAFDESVEDQSATMASFYFAEDARAIWELGRLMSYGLPGKTRAGIDADFARFEEVLMNRRNRAWIPVILDALDEGRVFAAFGALHLSGKEGVLALLEGEGFTLERLQF